MIVLVGLTMMGLSLSTAPAPTFSGAARAPAVVANDVPKNRCDATMNDGAVTAAIQSRLAWSPAIDAVDVRIFNTNGIVDVRGFVRTELQKTQVTAAASDTYGVARVNNNLDVVYWAPRTDAARLGVESRQAERVLAQTRSDAWIASAVRFTLSFSQAIDTCGIDVSSVDGAVSLRGKVATAANIDQAVLLARDTFGVRSVDATGLGH